jgi:hypothetical protein
MAGVPSPLSAGLVAVQTRRGGNLLVAGRALRRGEPLLCELPWAAVGFAPEGGGGAGPAARGDVLTASSVSRLAVQAIESISASAYNKEAFHKLCSNFSLRTFADKEKIRMEARHVVSSVMRVSSGAGLGEMAEQCVDVIDKLMANVFTVTGPEMDPVGAGLYLAASRFNHSCSPNAAQSFHGQKLIIRATRDIPCGEEVTISYIDTGQPTHVRRHELSESYQFLCNCAKCCVADPYEGFKCFSKACSGACHMDVDISSLKYKNISAGFQAKSPTRTWHHHFPYVSDIEGILITISNDGMVYQKPCTENFSCTFTCSKCSRQVTLTEWVEVLNKISLHRSKKDSTLSWARDDVALLRSHLHDVYYIVMESLNDLVLKLLKASRFEEAFSVNVLALPIFFLLYPKISMIIAIQEYQHAKLLAYLGDTRRAARHLDDALASFAIVCGSDSELFRDAEQYRYSLAS